MAKLRGQNRLFAKQLLVWRVKAMVRRPLSCRFSQILFIISYIRRISHVRNVQSRWELKIYRFGTDCIFLIFFTKAWYYIHSILFADNYIMQSFFLSDYNTFAVKVTFWLYHASAQNRFPPCGKGGNFAVFSFISKDSEHIADFVFVYRRKNTRLLFPLFF